MKTTSANWHIAGQNLKIAPYLLAAGVLVAATLSIWVPAYPWYLALAIGVGSLAFAIQWFGVRHHAHLGPISTIVTIVAFMIGRDFLVGDSTDRAVHSLCAFQFMGVWMIAFSALHVIFRKRLTKDLEVYAQPNGAGNSHRAGQ